MPRRKVTTSEPKPRRPPAMTQEGRENQLIALAVNLAEEQLSTGTASAQVITHYLKLATTRETLEKEKLSRENELLKAKSDAIASAQRVEDLYKQALTAMRAYGGHGNDQSYETSDDY